MFFHAECSGKESGDSAFIGQNTAASSCPVLVPFPPRRASATRTSSNFVASVNNGYCFDRNDTLVLNPAGQRDA